MKEDKQIHIFGRENYYHHLCDTVDLCMYLRRFQGLSRSQSVQNRSYRTPRYGVAFKRLFESSTLRKHIAEDIMAPQQVTICALYAMNSFIIAKLRSF